MGGADGRHSRPGPSAAMQQLAKHPSRRHQHLALRHSQREHILVARCVQTVITDVLNLMARKARGAPPAEATGRSRAAASRGAAQPTDARLGTHLLRAGGAAGVGHAAPLPSFKATARAGPHPFRWGARHGSRLAGSCREADHRAPDRSPVSPLPLARAEVTAGQRQADVGATMRCGRSTAGVRPRKLVVRRRRSGGRGQPPGWR